MYHRYKLGFAILESPYELTDEVIEGFSGGLHQSVAKQQFLAQHGYPPYLYKVFPNLNHDYYYLQNIGYIHYSQWQELLGEDFTDFKITITQWCVEHNIPRSFDRWLKEHSQSYIEHCKDSRYIGLISSLRINGSNFGKIVNIRKINGHNQSATRTCTNIKRSYLRALELCKSYSIKPLFTEDNWIGTHIYESCKVHMYKVRCELCGYEYETYFHSSTVKCCPRCTNGTYRALRECQVSKMLTDLGIEHFCNYKYFKFDHSFKPFELDIYIPSLSVAFEFNGRYFHSTLFHDKDYHLNKTLVCLQNGIKLYHFWDNEQDSTVASMIHQIVKGTFKVVGRIISRDKCPESPGDNYKFILGKPNYMTTLPITLNNHYYKSNTTLKASEVDGLNLDEYGIISYYTAGYWKKI